MSPRRAPRDLHEHAMGKLVRVLGEDRARRLFTSVCDKVELARIESADDLARFAEALKARGGFDGVLGSMLAVDAVRLQLEGLLE